MKRFGGMTRAERLTDAATGLPVSFVLPPPYQHAVVDPRRLITIPWGMWLQWLLDFGIRTYSQGTHADRVDPDKPGNDPARFRPGAWFWETDRQVLYQSRIAGGEAYWWYVAGTMRDTLAGIPADLEVPDAGFLFHSTDYLRTWRWHLFAAYTDLVIGLVNTQLTSAARPFTAADTGRVLTITGGTGFTAGRYTVLSVAGSTATVDSPAGTASSTGGKGILSGWEYAPGERLEHEIVWYPGTVPAGWALCDGSAVTATTAAAGTASFTTPDLTGQYPKGGTYTGAVVPAAIPSVTGNTADESGHTHSTDPAIYVTQTPDSGGLPVALGGTGDQASRFDHKHYFDLPAATSSAGTAHHHDPGTLALSGASEPAHVLLLPVIKL